MASTNYLLIKFVVHYVKQKVPLPELMEKMGRVETVYPLLGKIERNVED